MKMPELTYTGMDIMPLPVYDDDAPPPGVDDYAVIKPQPPPMSQVIIPILFQFTLNASVDVVHH